MARFAVGAYNGDGHLDLRVELSVGNGDIDVEHLAAATDERLVQVDDAGVGVDAERSAVVLAVLREGGAAKTAIRFDAECEHVVR